MQLAQQHDGGNLCVTAVQNIAYLHNDGVAADPPGHTIVKSGNAGQAQAAHGLVDVPVDITNYANEVCVSAKFERANAVARLGTAVQGLLDAQQLLIGTCHPCKANERCTRLTCAFSSCAQKVELQNMAVCEQNVHR